MSGIKSGELVSALKRAEKVLVTSKPRTPVFTQLCFSGDHLITMNDYIAVREKLPVTLPDFLQVVPGLPLIQFVKALPQDIELQFQVEEGDKISISTAKGSKLVLPSFPREEYPCVEFEEKADFFLPEELLEDLKVLSFSITSSPIHAQATGISITASQVAATNGSTITRIANRAKTIESLFIPIHSLKLLETFPKGESVGVVEKEDRLFFFSQETCLLVLCPHTSKERARNVSSVMSICDDNLESRLFDAVDIPEGLELAVKRLASAGAESFQWIFKSEGGVMLKADSAQGGIEEHLDFPDVEQPNRVLSIPIDIFRKALVKSSKINFSRKAAIITREGTEYFIGLSSGN